MSDKEFDKQMARYKAGKLNAKAIKALAEAIELDPEKRMYALHGALAMGKPALAFKLLNRLKP